MGINAITKTYDQETSTVKSMAKEKDGNLQSRKNNLKFDYSTGDPPRKSICQRNWKQVHAKELRTWRCRSSTLRICLQTQTRSGWEDGKLPTESGGRRVGWGLGRLLQGRREIDDESNGGGRGITVLVDGEGNGGVGNAGDGQQLVAGGASPRIGEAASGNGSRAGERWEERSGARMRIASWWKKTASGTTGCVVVSGWVGDAEGNHEGKKPVRPGENRCRRVRLVRVRNTLFHTV